MSSAGVTQTVTDAPLTAASTLPVWRRSLIVLGAGLGLMTGFAGLYYASLPFFLLPMSTEFGWSRADISAAAVLSMLGASIGGPLVGKLFERLGTERVIVCSMLLFALGMLSLSWLPANFYALAGLSFAIGLLGSATTIVGYLSILPRWFDRRLGLALGLAGLGMGAGVGLSPTLTTHLIGQFGWRGAYQAMAALAFVVGLMAWLLIAPRGHTTLKQTRAHAASQTLAEGTSLKEALSDWRFWLLLAVIFLTTFGILGAAIHGATLFSDRGLTPQQAALAAGLAGLGAMLARVTAGALLDRFFAPAIGTLFFLIGATGLLMNHSTATFQILVVGTFLGGVAIGAEADLLPYLVRRYFGMRAFGAIFGCLFVAYAIGGVVGPIAYGFVFDRSGSYSLIMLVSSAACVLSALSVLLLGSYRYSVGQPA